MLKRLFCFVIPGILLGPYMAVAETVLVEDAMPRATIVVAADEPQAAQAAAEIQRYVEKISGATLPIAVEGNPVETPVSILVGHTAGARKLGVKIPSGFDPSIRPDAFEEEGYVLKTRGSSLVVAGNSDGPYQGTLYAAYAFLEQLGCRWYFPGEWGEVVPRSQAVTVPELDVMSRPDFAVRGVAMLGWVAQKDRAIYSAWCPKVGFSGRDMYPVAGDGFLSMLLPPGEYAEAHPEYYAMNEEGKRTATPKSQVYFTMLCLSNPDVVNASIENLKAAFAGEKTIRCVTANGLGISPPDGTPFCHCEACRAASRNFRYPTYFAERMMSEEYCGFAAELAGAFPEKYVALSAYSLRVMPPQGVPLPPNVSVSIWPISSCVLHAGNDPACWRRQETMKIVAGWRKLTPHVVANGYTPGLLSTYVPYGARLPERDVANFTAEAPLLKELDVKGSYAQGTSSFMNSWLSYYVRAKLLWDVTTDVAALKREFYDTFFGPEAGPHVQAWWDACEEALGRASTHAHEAWLVNHVYTVEFADSIHAHVEAARAATMTGEQRARFEAFALIADYLEAYAARNAAEMMLDYRNATAAAERMVEDMRKLNDIYSLFVLKPGPNGFPRARETQLQELAAKMDGTDGLLVTALPLEMKFTRDRFNEGVIAEWYAPSFDDAGWETKNTYYTWDQQDPPEDSAGHDYDGYGWYRTEVEINKRFAGKPVRIYGGGAINEAWVWVNGRYAGHKPHQLWWSGDKSFDLDVTDLVKPGKRNTVAIRVWNDAEIGGLYRRGFLYSPLVTDAPDDTKTK